MHYSLGTKKSTVRLQPWGSLGPGRDEVAVEKKDPPKCRTPYPEIRQVVLLAAVCKD